MCVSVGGEKKMNAMCVRDRSLLFFFLSALSLSSLEIE
jgi:hypothetical protein